MEVEEDVSAVPKEYLPPVLKEGQTLMNCPVTTCSKHSFQYAQPAGRRKHINAHHPDLAGAYIRKEFTSFENDFKAAVNKKVQMLGDLLKTPANRELYDSQGVDTGDDDVLNLELGIDEVLRAKLEQQHQDRFYNGPQLTLQMLEELDEEDWQDLEETFEEDYGYEDMEEEDRIVHKMLKFNNPDTFEEYQDLDDEEKRNLKFDEDREQDLAMILAPEQMYFGEEA